MSSAHKPRRRFAQHFLIDETIIEQIITVISPSPEEHLVEIGPGLGALTRVLAASGVLLDVIELDRDLARDLAGRLGNPGNLRVHIMDVLKTDITALAKDTRLRVLGNLPYNISSPVLFHLIAHREVITDMHLMLQNEVVNRLVASPGKRSFGRLSVMTQIVCRVEKLFTVPPESFSPPPKVNSAVVRLVPRDVPAAQVDDPTHFEPGSETGLLTTSQNAEELVTRAPRRGADPRRRRRPWGTTGNTGSSRLRRAQQPAVGVDARADPSDTLSYSQILWKTLWKDWGQSAK